MSSLHSGGPASPPTQCQPALGPLTGLDRRFQLHSLLRQALCRLAAENCPPASLLQLASPVPSPHGPLGPAPPVAGMLSPQLGQHVPLHGTGHRVTLLKQSLAIPSSPCPHGLSGDWSVHLRAGLGPGPLSQGRHHRATWCSLPTLPAWGCVPAGPSWLLNRPGWLCWVTRTHRPWATPSLLHKE